MPVTVIDSNVLIAAASVRDVDHAVASDIVNGIDDGSLPTGRVSNYVVAEVLNFVHAKRRHEFAVDLYDRLSRSSGFEIVHATMRDYHRATEIFRDHEELSFVDATIVSYMEREELAYVYSFDDDFDRVDGTTRLNAPEDPFA